MTDNWGPDFKAGERGLRSRGKNGPKGRPARDKARGNRKRKAEHALEQPIAQTARTVRCPVCGCGVDPVRLHIHMVRFHGVALRPGRP
jgi:hypothetical protein